MQKYVLYIEFTLFKIDFPLVLRYKKGSGRYISALTFHSVNKSVKLFHSFYLLYPQKIADFIFKIHCCGGLDLFYVFSCSIICWFVKLRKSLFVSSRFGFNKWRDPLKPTQILQRICKDEGLDGPHYASPGKCRIENIVFSASPLIMDEAGMYCFVNPGPHGVIWITHTWRGQILPAPYSHSPPQKLGTSDEYLGSQHGARCHARWST